MSDYLGYRNIRTVSYPKLPWHEKAANYHKYCLTQFLNVARGYDFSGKRILEIGGSGEFGLTKTLFNLSGRIVDVVNPESGISSEFLDDSKFMLMRDCLENIHFGTEKYDVIIGVAVLEHILNLDLVFERCYDILTPDGIIMLHGGPCWTSHHGHHVYLHGADRFYDFNDPHSGIEDFSHLYLAPDEMHSHLLQKGICGNDAQQITRQIYSETHINRLPAENIVEQFLMQPWNAVTIGRDEIVAPPLDIISRIRDSGRIDPRHIGTYNLFIVAVK